MRVAYVGGPYRAGSPHGIVENIRNAEAVAIELWKMGFAVICPHKNTALFDGVCEDHVWLYGDIEILKRCDLLVLAPGWEKSIGTREEIRVADSEDIPHYVWPNDIDKIQEELLYGLRTVSRG